MSLGIPNGALFCYTYCAIGLVCLLTAWPRKYISTLFFLAGLSGIYGVSFYGICIHAPRSVWLLAQKYGRSIYIAWAIFTILVFCTLQFLEGIASQNVMGGILGILFAHIFLTAYIREENEDNEQVTKKIRGPYKMECPC